MGGLSVKGKNQEQLDMAIGSEKVYMNYWQGDDMKSKEIPYEQFVNDMAKKYFGGVK